jgi:hypothetical protein
MVRRGLGVKARWAGAGLAMCRHDRAKAATAAVSDHSGLAGGGQCLRPVTVLHPAACRQPEVWLALLDQEGGSPASARRQSALPPRLL